MGWLAAVMMSGTWAAAPVHIGSVDHAPISEQSGIVQSRQWPGTYWVLNDSGSAPVLFAIDRTGTVVVPPFLRGRLSVGAVATPGRPLYEGLRLDPASNIDWEDVAVGDDFLYVADMGNNGNARRDLGVYALPEPNPAAVTHVRPLLYWPVAYPGQRAFPGRAWHYDCEAMFWYRGSLYFLTKHRAAGQIGTPETSTDLYRLDTHHTHKVNMLRHVDQHADLGGWVTAADVSPQGTLAVLVHRPTPALWLFQAPRRGGAFLRQPSRRIELGDVGQAEGVAWIDRKHLLITNEERHIFEVTLDERAR